MDIIGGIDVKSTFYHYDVRVADDTEDLARYLDCDIVAPIVNHATGETELVIASAQPEELGIAAVAVMNEIEKRTRGIMESTIAMFALAAKDDYRIAVDYLFYRLSRQRNHAAQISFRGHGPQRPAGIIPESESARNISDRDIRQVYDSLPDRYSDLYEKRNPEAARIVRLSLDVIDQKSLVALLFETAKTDKRLLQNLLKAKQKMASRYGIRVRRWSSDRKRDFRDLYKYCIYLTDEKGNETPVKFRNNPSYCIFMMYVLDRFNRGLEATSLSYADNQAEFKRLYGSILNEDRGKIESICSEMIHRQVNDKGIIRKGRLDDYIKDVNDTLEEIVGCPDSIALKVGHGRFLEIPPHQIEIDGDLADFNFT